MSGHDRRRRNSATACRSKTIPVGLAIHNIELIPGRGGQMVRTAGGGGDADVAR